MLRFRMVHLETYRELGDLIRVYLHAWSGHHLGRDGHTQEAEDQAGADVLAFIRNHPEAFL